MNSNYKLHASKAIGIGGASRLWQNRVLLFVLIIVSVELHLHSLFVALHILPTFPSLLCSTREQHCAEVLVVCNVARSCYRANNGHVQHLLLMVLLLQLLLWYDYSLRTLLYVCRGS